MPGRLEEAADALEAALNDLEVEPVRDVEVVAVLEAEAAFLYLNWPKLDFLAAAVALFWE